MAWTYDITTDLGKVRARIGDVDSAAPLLTDAEVQTQIDANADLALAALRCAEQARAKIFRDVDRAALGINSSRSQSTTQLDAVIKELHAVVAGRATPFAGGGTPQASTATAADTFGNLDY